MGTRTAVEHEPELVLLVALRAHRNGCRAPAWQIRTRPSRSLSFSSRGWLSQICQTTGQSFTCAAAGGEWQGRSGKVLPARLPPPAHCPAVRNRRESAARPFRSRCRCRPRGDREFAVLPPQCPCRPPRKGAHQASPRHDEHRPSERKAAEGQGDVPGSGPASQRRTTADDSVMESPPLEPQC